LNENFKFKQDENFHKFLEKIGVEENESTLEHLNQEKKAQNEIKM